jgi:hypothetical protein
MVLFVLHKLDFILPPQSEQDNWMVSTYIYIKHPEIEFLIFA